MKLYPILFEAKFKQFRNVMRKVYSNLPDYIFQDMYAQEKQNENIVDPDIGGDIRTLTNDVLLGKPEAIEKMREYEKNRGSEWINTEWEKRPKVIDLKWNDLSDKKRNFFREKYLGLNLANFPAMQKEKKGYFDKVRRILASGSNQTEPVILLQRKQEAGYDVIGGNNRVFNGFLRLVLEDPETKKRFEVLNASQEVPQENINNFFKQVFDMLNKLNPSIKINAFTGKET
mgnify:CR=1 FL=1